MSHPIPEQKKEENNSDNDVTPLTTNNTSQDDETDKEEVVQKQNEQEDKSLKFIAVKSVGHCSEKNPRYRRVMEDEHVMLDTFIDKGSAFFAVYDGHGGRQTVECVSKNFHEILKKELANNPHSPQECLKKTFKLTDELIIQNKIQFSGCTVAVILILQENGKRKLYSANVGDARAVLARNGVSHRLTYDHKGSDESETKRIVDSGGFVIMNRVNGMLAVTRSLGDITMKDYVISDPYMQEHELLPTDSHVIIACDGLWDVVQDQEAYNLIKDEKSSQKASEKLMQTALSNGSTDNISIVVVQL